MTSGVTAATRRVLTHPSCYLLLACLILLAHEAFYYRELGGDAVDDAYISFRYAQNFVAGQGLVFNPGERVEGYTNFLWTILLASFLRLGFDPSRVAIVLGVLFSLASVCLVYVSCRVTSMSNSLVPVIAMLCLAVDGSFALWAVSGMETSMFAFLILGAVMLYVWEWRAEKPGVLSGAVLALASMTRPEGVLVLGIVVIHQVLARLALRRRVITAGDVARVAVFLAIYLPYFLWRYYYYGFLLPNTFYAKVAVSGSAAQYERGLRHLGTFAALHLGWLAALLVLVPVVKRKFTFWLTLLLGLVATYVGYIVFVGGDWSVGRFFAPILPMAYLLVATGSVEAYESLVGYARRATNSARLLLSGSRGVGAGVLALALLALFNFSSLRGEHELFVVRFQAARATFARVALGKWLRQNVPADTFIAVDAAGQIPYHSGLPTLDMFGVNDVHTAHLEVEDMGEGVPGHEKFDLDYIMWRRPDLIIATAPFLDGLDSYLRMDVPWIDDPSLHGFLYIYRRKGWIG
jgi:arabinofuranosyltransferase